jgi:penicillin G amidase
MRRVVRVIPLAVGLIVVLGAGGGFWATSRLRASLPHVDGRLELRGLTAPVIVTRDALGIPTIRGTTRQDVARATGFLHAQDRFFQMDLARRRAAGELSDLVGARALMIDREIRIHRFRDEAQRAVALLQPHDRAILDAYTAGVNGGLHALGASPFEYLMLRQTPRDWWPEDSLLVVLSMFITLQDADGSYEATLATMHDVLPGAVVDFLAPRGTEWDSPVDGSAFTMPAIPGPEVFDLRHRRRGKPSISLPPPKPEEVRKPKPQIPNPKSQLALGSWLGRSDWELGVDSEAATGSNSFAVAGSLTSDGAALVANDMHLAVRVPNTWYRAALEWNDGTQHRLIGVTLPGVPALVTGSNTQVAWGFTNTYADWTDIVLLDIDPSRPDRYRTPDGWQTFEHHDEVVRIAGGRDVHLDAQWTIWGPVIDPDYHGRARALRWVAHSAERLASSVAPLESASTIEEAFDAVNGLGVPGQNMVVADRSGRIGWTIFGAVPRRVGMDGQLPTSWSDGARGWNGWLSSAEYPRIINPDRGRLWTANARVVGGEMLAKLGDGSYEIGSRARIIRDRLLARDRFGTRDLLDIQLDAHAVFLARWRDLLLRTLTPSTLANHPDRSEFRDVVDSGWSGVAAPDSAAYRLTRMFREDVSDRVIAFLLSECYEADPMFDYKNVRRRDGPIWTLVNEQPMHLLDPEFASWNDLLLDAVDTVTTRVHAEHPGPLKERVWSEFNQTLYRHPLSGGVPMLGRWLDMPATPLPGDLYTPNMHWRSNAPSERMIVSPGHEDTGIMHMPTGQSGHPLSPFYGNSHDAWVRGQATPFLPGATTHMVTLTPSMQNAK